MSKSPPVNAAAPAPERLIFESGSPGRSAFFWDEDEPPLTPLPEVLMRSEIAGFPELGELGRQDAGAWIEASLLRGIADERAHDA